MTQMIWMELETKGDFPQKNSFISSTTAHLLDKKHPLVS
jgi:hypothetical protein